MDCWRVLELDDAPSGAQIPQLLIKPKFVSREYTVFLTDLSSIWSEHLDFGGMVERALEVGSPIEISQRDFAQLAILLENVQKSLSNANDTTCHITRDNLGGLILHTSIALPEPLDSLQWEFHLRKRTSTTLRNELTLPLLMSSHIQHERINKLIATINEKDRAITMLLDQFESSNLDLVSAFPSIGGSKSGRKVKREQAMRHVPALQKFLEEDWKKDTGQLDDGQISTLGLFQEALATCNSTVPRNLKWQHEDEAWWESIQTSLGNSHLATSKRKKAESPVQPRPVQDDEATETEDEFETHENFKLRESPRKSNNTKQTGSTIEREHQDMSIDDTTDDDDGDLDASPQKEKHSQTQSHKPSDGSSTREQSSRPVAPLSLSPSPKPRSGKNFRIGGAKPKSTKTSPIPAIVANSADGEDGDMRDDSLPARFKSNEDLTGAQGTRKGFKIGGKSKSSAQAEGVSTGTVNSSNSKRSARPPESNEEVASSDSAHQHASMTKPLTKPLEEEEPEETPEERAERKRQELKRKNEELAKKQAHRKKKRF